MINKFGQKLLLILLSVYSITLIFYLFFVINVLSNHSAVSIIVFSAINILIDYSVIMFGTKIRNLIGAEFTADILVFALIYTLMNFFTLIMARNFLLPWQYNAFEIFFLTLFIISVVGRLLNKFSNK